MNVTCMLVICEAVTIFRYVFDYCTEQDNNDDMLQKRTGESQIKVMKCQFTCRNQFPMWVITLVIVMRHLLIKYT